MREIINVNQNEQQSKIDPCGIPWDSESTVESTEFTDTYYFLSEK